MWATSIGFTSLQIPLPGVRKSGIPDGTEMPAPDSATTVPASRTRPATRSLATSMPVNLLDVGGEFAFHGDLAREALHAAGERLAQAPAHVDEVGERRGGRLGRVAQLEGHEGAAAGGGEPDHLCPGQTRVLDLRLPAAVGIALRHPLDHPPAVGRRPRVPDQPAPRCRPVVLALVHVREAVDEARPAVGVPPEGGDLRGRDAGEVLVDMDPGHRPVVYTSASWSSSENASTSSGSNCAPPPRLISSTASDTVQAGL